MIRAIQSPTAAVRLREARAFLGGFPPGDEILLVGASRGAVDDFARAIAMEKGATFGLHRLSFTQLAARLAALHLASQDRAPATSLGHEAVATRATFEGNKEDALEYFSPVAGTPGFPKALARTLLELRLAGTSGAQLSDLPRSGPDLAELLERVDQLMSDAGASDRAALFETATKALLSPQPGWPPMPTVLLDVPFESEAEARFLWALLERQDGDGRPDHLRQGYGGQEGRHEVPSLITVPTGDARTLARLEKCGVQVQLIQDAPNTDLGYLTRFLFSKDPPPERERTGELVWFSAPGEGRECVEIARRILKEASACGPSEARSGRARASGGGTPRAMNNAVRFDEMAILVRSPQQYIGLLEHALGRAGIPAYFDRGTRRPHPAGRAFLAILTCAVERFSAKRFAEYLSLAQVPNLGQSATNERQWVVSKDDVFGTASEDDIVDDEISDAEDVVSPKLAGVLGAEADEPNEPDEPHEPHEPDKAVVNGTLRAPWKWESLLAESAVIGGADRWKRRLDGLDREYALKIRALQADEPDSPKIARLERDRQNLAHLRAFALPLIEMMAAWLGPRSLGEGGPSASWGDWLQRLEGLAPRVLRRPADVLRVLADLRPMGAVGPATLKEVRDVLADRLMSLEVDPPAHRYGRVFIGSPHQARGRSFRVVFVPGLAERLFPQKLREDPLLLDDLRREISQRDPRDLHDPRDLRDPRDLPIQEDRAELERLLLRLSVGAATERLYASFPRIETAEVRQRVPSFYALEVMRAVTGRIPDHQLLETEAAQEAKASLAWPAPEDPAVAIDDLEHDLSVLRRLMRSNEDVRGHAHYMLRLNDCLRRSATERWGRSRPQWSTLDGIVRVTDATREYLKTQRLGERPYSVSALQHYAQCPYRFLLSAMYRLEPLEEPEPLQRLDPLTKGSLFHEVQAEFFRALQKKKLPIGSAPIEAVLQVLDDTLTGVAGKYAEEVSPAVDRVWRDEIANIRTDLHIWARDLAATTEWEPLFFEYAFGLTTSPSAAGADVGRDPNSLKDPITIDNRFKLRGSVDLIERKTNTKVLRITDHKTGKNRTERRSIIGAGQQLQPVIYSLAVESATGHTVESARFSYCTTAGGFTEHSVPINEQTRRVGLEVMEIIDRAIELGVLPPAPAERACRYCDFLSVCGPDQERRASRKSKQLIADLLELRAKP